MKGGNGVRKANEITHSPSGEPDFGFILGLPSANCVIPLPLVASLPPSINCLLVFIRQSNLNGLGQVFLRDGFDLVKRNGVDAVGGSLLVFRTKSENCIDSRL